MTVQQRFRELHAHGTFVMPNPYDVGSAKLLAAMGFSALATTSAGFAGTLGRRDMTQTYEELVGHVTALAFATPLPLNVDAERCFSDTADGVADVVEAFGDAGAAGCSIEDWNPVSRSIDEVDTMTARVAAAVRGAAARGVVVTARCENHLNGIDDLDDTIRRLRAYGEAGADVLYAPGLTRIDDIRRVVGEAGKPVNVLLMPGGPTVAQLAEAGVRRVSLGSLLARIAHGAVVRAAQNVLDNGSIGTDAPFPDSSLLRRAFGG